MNFVNFLDIISTVIKLLRIPCGLLALSIIIVSMEVVSFPAQALAQEKMVVIPVEKVVFNPEKYKGVINVSGVVLKIGKPGEMSILGCKDKCAKIPIRFEKSVPSEGIDVVVTGEIVKQNDGRFYFRADKVASK